MKDARSNFHVSFSSHTCSNEISVFDTSRVTDPERESKNPEKSPLADGTNVGGNQGDLQRFDSQGALGVEKPSSPFHDELLSGMPSRSIGAIGSKKDDRDRTEMSSAVLAMFGPGIFLIAMGNDDEGKDKGDKKPATKMSPPADANDHGRDGRDQGVKSAENAMSRWAALEPGEYTLKVGERTVRVCIRGPLVPVEVIQTVLRELASHGSLPKTVEFLHDPGSEGTAWYDRFTDSIAIFTGLDGRPRDLSYLHEWGHHLDFCEVDTRPEWRSRLDSAYSHGLNCSKEIMYAKLEEGGHRNHASLVTVMMGELERNKADYMPETVGFLAVSQVKYFLCARETVAECMMLARKAMLIEAETGKLPPLKEMLERFTKPNDPRRADYMQNFDKLFSECIEFLKAHPQFCVALDGKEQLELTRATHWKTAAEGGEDLVKERDLAERFGLTGSRLQEALQQAQEAQMKGEFADLATAEIWATKHFGQPLSEIKKNLFDAGRKILAGRSEGVDTSRGELLLAVRDELTGLREKLSADQLTVEQCRAYAQRLGELNARWKLSLDRRIQELLDENKERGAAERATVNQGMKDGLSTIVHDMNRVLGNFDPSSDFNADDAWLLLPYLDEPGKEIFRPYQEQWDQAKKCERRILSGKEVERPNVIWRDIEPVFALDPKEWEERLYEVVMRTAEQTLPTTAKGTGGRAPGQLVDRLILWTLLHPESQVSKQVKMQRIAALERLRLKLYSEGTSAAIQVALNTMPAQGNESSPVPRIESALKGAKSAPSVAAEFINDEGGYRLSLSVPEELRVRLSEGTLSRIVIPVPDEGDGIKSEDLVFLIETEQGGVVHVAGAQHKVLSAELKPLIERINAEMRADGAEPITLEQTARSMALFLKEGRRSQLIFRDAPGAERGSAGNQAKGDASKTVLAATQETHHKVYRRASESALPDALKAVERPQLERRGLPEIANTQVDQLSPEEQQRFEKFKRKLIARIEEIDREGNGSEKARQLEQLLSDLDAQYREIWDRGELKIGKQTFVREGKKLEPGARDAEFIGGVTVIAFAALTLYFLIRRLDPDHRHFNLLEFD